MESSHSTQISTMDDTANPIWDSMDGHSMIAIENIFAADVTHPNEVFCTHRGEVL
jgi:hypothetical protein